jgi:tRNA dimethylallyltransferase
MSDLEGCDIQAIPVIVGPTAIGKTAVALEIAERCNLEIVSCDSRQIYKYLDIGTAKPGKDELRGQPYHLIDFVEPDRLYSAARYRLAANEVIEMIRMRGRTPLIVGGTGLYLKSLISGFFETPEADMGYRERLSALSASELHARLQQIDPESAAEIPANNRVRVIRALEIAEITGMTKSLLRNEGRYPVSTYRFVVFGITCSRQKLYQFINLRVDKMIEGGMVAEVERIISMGYLHSPVLASTVGYREMLEFLDRKISYDRCVELIKQRTRNYAKRQITWFKRTPNLVEIDQETTHWRDLLFERIQKIKLDTSAT